MMTILRFDAVDRDRPERDIGGVWIDPTKICMLRPHPINANYTIVTFGLNDACVKLSVDELLNRIQTPGI